jgi:hypothetical protein
MADRDVTAGHVVLLGGRARSVAEALDLLAQIRSVLAGRPGVARR